MKTASLKIQINTLPKNLRQEVADFVAFLKSKANPNSQLKEREFGYAKGKITISEDFDEPLDEFKNYA